MHGWVNEISKYEAPPELPVRGSEIKPRDVDIKHQRLQLNLFVITNPNPLSSIQANTFDLILDFTYVSAILNYFGPSFLQYAAMEWHKREVGSSVPRRKLILTLLVLALLSSTRDGIKPLLQQLAASQSLRSTTLTPTAVLSLLSIYYFLSACRSTTLNSRVFGLFVLKRK